MKHRIAVIVPGGVGKDRNIPSLVELLLRLSLSYSISIYSFADGDLHPLLAAQGVVLSVPSGWFLRRKIYSVAYLIYRIQLDHRANAFSLLHCFWVIPSGLAAMAANMTLRLPVVLSLPGGDTVRIPSIHYGNMRSPVFRSLIRRCCRSADRVVLLTRYQAALTERSGIALRDARIIPFGVDASRFPFRPPKLSTPLRMISIGSINRVKNVFLQVETFALLCREIECRFTIVGKDVLQGQVREFAESLNVADLIEWKGKCAHAEIPSLLHASHVMLHTAWFEAEGVAIMEAFAAGTVVVGPRVGLLADTDPEGVCTVGLHDARALADKVLSLVRDPQLFASLQKKNRKFAERFTIDRTAAEYRAVYGEVCRSVRYSVMSPASD